MSKEKGGDDADLFIEIKQDDTPKLPKLIEVYVAQVEPQRCRSLLKILGRDIPLGSPKNDDNENQKLFDLMHLKRVKKSKSNGNKEEDPQKSPSKKKQRKQDDNRQTDVKPSLPLLEILLRDVESLEGEFGTNMRKQSKENASESTIDFLKAKYEMAIIVKRMVPGRPPESHQEWQDFQNDYWPTIFFPQRSKEHLDQQLKLSSEELQQMRVCMDHAIQDWKTTCPQATAGAVIVDPSTGNTVACAGEERRLQLGTASSILNNPLATPVLFAIQGVSRLEREKAISAGMGSSEFQKGQYLCTGYDLYTTHEPTVFEAMSLVHSRVRRVVFGQSHEAGGLHLLYIHALPSTNHHYRAFQCLQRSDLWNQCQT